MKPRPKSELTKCDECTLQSYGYVPMQEPSYSQFPVLFYGQAPGETEVITGVPFTGKAGKMAWRLLKEAGLNKSRLHISNIAGCAPPEDRKPTDEEVSCCHNRVYDEIQRIQPELIVALGEVPAKALTGYTKITGLRGQMFPLLTKWDWDCPVLCVLHPSFVMRQRQWIDMTIEDLKQVVGFFTGERIEIIEEEQPNFIFDPDKHRFIEELEIMRQQITAFDIETPGELNPRKAEVIGISFSGSEDKAIALDISLHDSRWEVMKCFLEDKDAAKVAQNGQFDIACLETSGVLVKGLVHDTLLAEHLLNSELPGDLNFLRGKYTAIKPYKPTRKEMKTIQNWPKERRLNYSCYDALVTHIVMNKQIPLLSSGQKNVLSNIYVPLIYTINKMERKGVKVDVPMLALMYADLLPKAEAIDEKYFAPLGLNPNSPKQLAAYWGLTSTAKFNTKMARVNPEGFLDFAIKRGHPDAERMQALLDYRQITKAASTELKGIYLRLEDNYIHTDFNIEGTGTGRISSQNPNLQNINEPYRVIYIADDEDSRLVVADYSQLELIVAAILGNETTLLDQAAKGIKPHHILGKAMFGREWSELTVLEKLREKAALFGTMGGRSALSIAREFSVPVSLAEEWQAMCVNQYPGLLRYKEETLEIFKQTGKVYTAFDTERIVSSGSQAMNNRFQGSASFVTLTTLNKLDKAGFDLRLTIHDSIIFHCKANEVTDVVNVARPIIERPIKELKDHCFKAAYKSGYNWYDLEEI